MRWGIEVYFKAAKQHLGFLVEQTRTFASHTASIHLTAIRYWMLVHAKLNNPGLGIGDARATIQEQLNKLSFAGDLWDLFRGLVSETLIGLGKELGCSVATIMHTVDEKIEAFLTQSLQLDSFTLQVEF